jgi:hypothetical protein
MSNPLCEKLSLMSTEQQKDILLTIMWSLRHRVRTFPEFKKTKVSVTTSSLLVFGEHESAKKLTTVPIPENNGLLKKIADCLNTTCSQSDEMALTVLNSFCLARGGACQHFNCKLAEALIPEGDVFLIDRDTIFTADDQLLFVPVPGTQNSLTSFLKGRLTSKVKEPVVF